MQTCEACEDCAVSVEPEKPSCGCRKHKQALPVQTDDLEIAKAHTCHKTIPTDKQDDHVPGCPAKEGSAVWKANTTQPSPVGTLDLAGLLVSVDVAVPVSILPVPSIPVITSNRPIYLTTLTLRI